MSTESDAEFRREAVRFLERDFAQCFQQMRHYDAQIFDICKFAFTAYTAVAGAAIAIYKYGVDKGIDYQAAAIAIVTIGLFLGLFMTALLVRNRSYFVLAARYVNEHRKFFLSSKPLGFENRSRMYSDWGFPRYFSWHSSQTLLLLVLSGLNAFLASALTFLSFTRRSSIVLLIFAACWLSQLVIAIAYLRSRERAGYRSRGR